MKTNKNKLESFVYICFCIGTFGALAVLRVVISQAIRKAFEED